MVKLKKKFISGIHHWKFKIKKLGIPIFSDENDTIIVGITRNENNSDYDCDFEYSFSKIKDDDFIEMIVNCNKLNNQLLFKLNGVIQKNSYQTIENGCYYTAYVEINSFNSSICLLKP